MADALKQAARQALEALRECRELIQTDRTSLADSEMDPVTNTIPTDAQEMLDEYDSNLANAEDAVQLLTAALSETEAVQVPRGFWLAPDDLTAEMLDAGNKAAHEGGCDLYQLKRELLNAWPAFRAAAPQPPAQAEPCEMGPICIGCEPRGPRWECPGATAEARHGFYVLVNAGALQMVRNALKRDADEGKQSRREILEELEATIRPVQAQAEARGDGPAQIADYLMAQADLCPEISPTRATLVSCAAVIRCGLYKDGGPAPAAPQAGEDIPLKMALEALTAMRERAEAAEAKLASQPMSREVIDPVEVAEAMRKRFVKLPRFSFMLGDPPSVRRVPDRYGNWLEFQTVHELFDAVHVDAALRDAGIGSGSGEGSGKGVA